VHIFIFYAVLVLVPTVSANSFAVQTIKHSVSSR